MGKQESILEAIKIEMSSGRSLEEATREVMKGKQFNYLAVRKCAEKLARDYDKLSKWTSGA